jgi:hypothetical protein
MSINNYNTIPQLIKKIEENAVKLEQGNLSITELNDMLDFSRAIHERIAILRYKALIKEPIKPQDTSITSEKSFTEKSLFNEISTKKEKIVEEKAQPTGFSLNFEVKDEEPKPTQIELVNEIEENTVDKSINDQLSSQKKVSIAERLQKSKVEDLRKVIGLNQKFLFMNDLFEGEKAHYDFALNFLNELSTLEEADNFIKNDLATKHGWDFNTSTAKNFKELVERKFS